MDLRKYIEERLKELDEQFIPGTTRIPISSPTFGVDEILESIDSLVTARVTIGAKVRRFEQDFARYLGSPDAVCLNSGSSANLVATMILTNAQTDRALRPNANVVVPAVSWSTTVFPIVDAGLMPVIVDVDPDTLNLDIDQAEDALSDATGALMPIHLLGNPADMGRIMDLAHRHGLFVIEDACEAHGASINGKKVGTFGDVGTYSFYFSHHITTIEGGMLVSNREEFIELAKTFRAHGYARDLRNAQTIASKYPEIDSRFLFVNRGFNVRPTEIQGAFGIHQTQKLDGFIRRRVENASQLRKELGRYEAFFRFQKVLPGHEHVYLGFSLVIRKGAPFSKADLVRFLEASKIETRPIVAGNIAEQPAMSFVPHKVHGNLMVAREIMRKGLYFGVHQGIGPEQRGYIFDRFETFMKQYS